MNEQSVAEQSANKSGSNRNPRFTSPVIMLQTCSTCATRACNQFESTRSFLSGEGTPYAGFSVTCGLRPPVTLGRP